jgi:hypothetical protein
MRSHSKPDVVNIINGPVNGLIFTAVKIPKRPNKVKADLPILVFKLGRTDEETLIALFGRLMIPANPLNTKSDT